MFQPFGDPNDLFSTLKDMTKKKPTRKGSKTKELENEGKPSQSDADSNVKKNEDLDVISVCSEDPITSSEPSQVELVLDEKPKTNG